MKTILTAAVFAAFLTTGAVANDIGVISLSPSVGSEPESDWTGFYAGIFAGAERSEYVSSLKPSSLPAYVVVGDKIGGIAGVQLGYDYQIDSVVLGAVADIALSNFATGLSDPALGLNYSSKLDYLGTVRARAGFLPTDKLLIYVHGGLAYGRFSPVVTSSLVAFPDLATANRLGWTVGAGFEYALTEHVSLQTEYAYADLGTVTTSNAGTPPLSATETLKFQSVRAGVNFRF